MQGFKSWRRNKPPKRSRKPREYQPTMPGLIGRRVSGAMLSDPDYWRELKEAEAEAERKSK